MFIALVALGGACGSTVSRSAQQAAERTVSGTGLGGDAIDGATDSAGLEGSALRSGGRTTGDSGRAAAGAGGSAARAIPAINGPGVDDKTIKVGSGYAVNSQAANAALGAGGISQGDVQGETRIVVDDINAHGGVAGRKLELVAHEYDNTSADSADVQEQQACDTYTQDDQIFVSMDGGRDTFLKCMHERGVLTIANPLTIADTSTFARYPYYVEITSLRLDRMARHYSRLLNAQGYFGGWNTQTGTASPIKAKVGIVTYDYPTFANAVDKVLVPQLRQLGYAPDPDHVRKVTWLQSNSDTGAVAAAISSAVLRFRTDDVTHVLIVDERALLTLLFLQQAQSQRFFPRYGFNTQNGPQALADTAEAIRPQLVGSKGIGWLPQLDMSAAEDTPTGPYSNDARRKCNALYRSKGVEFPDRNAEAGALGICNSFWFFRDVMNSVRAPINRDAFMAGVNRLGGSYVAPEIFATYFSAAQHDGVAAVRYYAHDPVCDCMTYKSGNVSVN